MPSCTTDGLALGIGRGQAQVAGLPGDQVDHVLASPRHGARGSEDHRAAPLEEDHVAPDAVVAADVLQVPLTRTPRAAWTARLTVFSGKIPDWIVQIPAASVEAIRAPQEGEAPPRAPRHGRPTSTDQLDRSTGVGAPVPRPGPPRSSPRPARRRRGRRAGGRAAWPRRTPPSRERWSRRSHCPPSIPELGGRSGLLGVLGTQRDGRGCRRGPSAGAISAIRARTRASILVADRTGRPRCPGSGEGAGAASPRWRR